MRFRVAILITLALLPGVSGRTCINEITPSYELKDPRPFWERWRRNRVEAVVARAKLRGDKSRWEARLKQLDDALKTEPNNFGLLNDRGAALAHLGKAQEALVIWLALEAREPGHYELAANIGTGFELVDDLPNAKKWITEGMKRNSGDHHGTEWLHLMILDAKLKLKENSGWLAQNSVLGLDFGRDYPELPKKLPLSNTGTPLTAQAVVEALEYQLEERLQFVNPPDPVVADLLVSWGYMLEVGGELKAARSAFHLAAHFGSQQPKELESAQSRLEEFIRNEHESLIDGMAGIGFLLLILIAAYKLGRLLWRWIRKPSG